MKLKISIVATLTLLLFCGQSIALDIDIGSNITVYDRESTSATGWYGKQEDQEVEPGNVKDQIWDLEGFFLKGNQLAIVGGFDFQNGVAGNDGAGGDDYWTSGDIFFDFNHDAVLADILPENSGTGNVVQTTNNSYGYDYVVDVDWTNGSYVIREITSTTLLTTYFGSNNRANPWKWGSTEDTNGDLIPGSSVGTVIYDSGTDAQTGFEGGNHNVAIFDLTELFDLPNISADDFLAHFTIECGNDNLIGAVPEPSTMVISGIFLIGAGFFVRRKLHGDS